MDEPAGFPSRGFAGERADDVDNVDYDRVDAALAGLARVSRGCIDASTIIYAQKAGFLDRVAAVLDLVSTEDVLREARFEGPGIRTAEVPVDPNGAPDDGLLHAAVMLGIPVLSDDKRVLTRAKAAGLDCFNAIMLLHLLRIRRRIGRAEHAELETALLQVAWYGPMIRRFARACFERSDQ